MKKFAFKRSQDPLFHPLYISEYFELESDIEGYETLFEEHFIKELSLNEKRQKSHEEYLKSQEAYKKREENDLSEQKIKEHKELEREFKLFTQWRKNTKKGK